MKAIGITGTRKGPSAKQAHELRELIERLEDGLTFHHGDCVGVDAFADGLVEKRGLPIVIHPPSDKKHRAFCARKGRVGTWICKAKDYIPRNHDIVNASEQLIAIPENAKEDNRSGTWATVRFARLKKKQIILILPDGTILLENE